MAIHIEPRIKGKYLVTRKFANYSTSWQMHTDNAREAVYEANKAPGSTTINNICGEKEFYRDETGRWRSRFI